LKAVLLVSPGSRLPKTKEEIFALVGALRQRLSNTIIKFAFLEIETPSIPEGIDQCVAQGALDITLALNFLNTGKHVDQDIPAIVQIAKKKYPKVKFAITKPIGQHPQIPDLFVDLIKNAEK
jgi:sirohydrochlorin ferrochelatase